LPPLLEVDRVSKSFGGVATNAGISFDVQQGEILGLIGPNGAGKTSLFNAISGEVTPDSGEIRLDGRRVSGLGPVACAARGIARTFQVVRSFDTMTVLENVMVGAYARHGRTRPAMRAATEMIEFCGLDASADRPAWSLSPAGKRRLEVARAARHPTAPAAAGRDADRPDAHRSRRRRAADPRRAGARRDRHHGRARHGGGAAAGRPRRGAEPRPRADRGHAGGDREASGRDPRLSGRPLCCGD
jgi:ABC-type ATPase involved in cell division